VTARLGSASQFGALAPKPRWRVVFEHGQIVLPGLYAWIATVGSLAVQPGAPVIARLTSAGAVLALLAAPLVVDDRPLLARVLGVYAFIGLSLVSWALFSQGLALERLDSLLAALGSIGFMLYAFGWGALRSRRAVPEDDPNVMPGPPLAPRERLPMLAAAILTASVIGALVPMLLAFRVTQAEHAVFAHAVATIAGIALIGGGARVALERSQPRKLGSARERMSLAAASLSLLGLALAAGVLWYFAH
jgi:hypothetical protein